MSTDDRTALILELKRNGATYDQIADRLGVTPQRVCRIVQTKGRREDDGERSGRGQGIPCPTCGGHSRTIRSYPSTAEGKQRRHECLSCGKRWRSLQQNLPEKLSTATDGVATD